MASVRQTPSSERAALVLIANSRIPCRDCGKHHEWFHDEDDRLSSADPNDGHHHRSMTPAAFARQVLAQTAGDE